MLPTCFCICGSVWGTEHEFISSPRLDDLQCTWACTKVLAESRSERSIFRCAVFDNEEVGSTTKQGAGSTFLQDVIDRICESIGAGAGEKRWMLAASLVASAGNGHAIHPTTRKRPTRQTTP